MIKKLIFFTLITLLTFSIQAEEKTYKMVFVPASEKGDESDYTTLISITAVSYTHLPLPTTPYV